MLSQNMTDFLLALADLMDKHQIEMAPFTGPVLQVSPDLSGSGETWACGFAEMDEPFETTMAAGPADGDSVREMATTGRFTLSREQEYPSMAEVIEKLGSEELAKKPLLILWHDAK